MRGISVVLRSREKVGTDPFHNPRYENTVSIVENVLIGEPSTEDITTTLTVEGKKLAYTLGIPKGDEHNWKDATVEFFGETFRTIGEPTKGIDHLVPTPWNMKVRVERYE